MTDQKKILFKFQKPLAGASDILAYSEGQKNVKVFENSLDWHERFTDSRAYYPNESWAGYKFYMFAVWDGDDLRLLDEEGFQEQPGW